MTRDEILAMARPMTRKERKAFQEAGHDPRKNANRLKKMSDEQNYDAIVEANDGMEDWILDNIYGDSLPDDAANPDCTALAKRTYELTFGMSDEDEKNS